jgi:hypothetical protein
MDERKLGCAGEYQFLKTPLIALLELTFRYITVTAIRKQGSGDAGGEYKRPTANLAHRGGYTQYLTRLCFNEQF